MCKQNALWVDSCFGFLSYLQIIKIDTGNQDVIEQRKVTTSHPTPFYFIYQLNLLLYFPSSQEGCQRCKRIATPPARNDYFLGIVVQRTVDSFVGINMFMVRCYSQIWNSVITRDPATDGDWSNLFICRKLDCFSGKRRTVIDAISGESKVWMFIFL